MPKVNHPHPILGENNGNFGYEFSFNCNIEYSIDNEHIVFTFTGNLIEPNIVEMLNEDKAEFLVRIDSTPYYSTIAKCADNQNRLKIETRISFTDIPSDFRFDIQPYIVSKISLDGYQNLNATSPLNSHSFNLGKGSVLARCLETSIRFKQGYLRHNSGSLLRIVKLDKNVEPQNGIMDIYLDDDTNILIKLSEDNHKKLLILEKKNSSIIDSILTLPVLQYVISELLKSDDYKHNSWAIELDNQWDIFIMDNDPKLILNKCLDILDDPVFTAVEILNSDSLDKFGEN